MHNAKQTVTHANAINCLQFKTVVGSWMQLNAIHYIEECITIKCNSTQ